MDGFGGEICIFFWLYDNLWRIVIVCGDDCVALYICVKRERRAIFCLSK